MKETKRILLAHGVQSITIDGVVFGKFPYMCLTTGRIIHYLEYVEVTKENIWDLLGY